MVATLEIHQYSRARLPVSDWVYASINRLKGKGPPSTTRAYNQSCDNNVASCRSLAYTQLNAKNDSVGSIKLLTRKRR